jgi:hypothetical protein
MNRKQLREHIQYLLRKLEEEKKELKKQLKQNEETRRS